MSEHMIPAEAPWSGLVKKGQTIRIIDSEGQQAVDGRPAPVRRYFTKPGSHRLKAGKAHRMTRRSTSTSRAR